MISKISKDVRIELKIVEQEKGIMKCEPVQYVCEDVHGNRYLLLIAVNPMQEHVLNRDVVAFGEHRQCQEYDVLEVIATGKIDGMSYSLYYFPDTMVKAKLCEVNKVSSVVSECNSDVEQVTEDILGAFLENWPEEIQEKIRKSDTFLLYWKELFSKKEILCGDEFRDYNGNGFFWDKVNEKYVIFSMDIARKSPNCRKITSSELVVENSNQLGMLKQEMISYASKVQDELYRADIHVVNGQKLKVYPDIVFNNPELLGREYKHLVISEWKKNMDMAVEIKGRKAILHCFLMPVSYIAIRQLICFLFQQYAVSVIEFENILYPIGLNVLTEQAVIVLPDNIEELKKRLSSKSRYNMRREKRMIRENIGAFDIEVYEGNKIPDDIVNKYFEYKKITHNRDFGMSPKQYIQQHGVTTAYVMKTETQILAMCLSCEESKNVYFENFSYVPEYKEYSIGSVIYDIYLEKLIKKGKEKVFLGNGQYEYKKKYGSCFVRAYTGKIYRYQVLNFLNYIYRCIVAYLKRKHLYEKLFFFTK